MKIVTDSAWNFLSIIIPSVIAIPAFGLIARIVGIELFGIFTLSFAIIGYASIFDIGLSRAVIRAVAQNRQQPLIVSQIINTAFTLILPLSLLACVVLMLCSGLIVDFIDVSLQRREDVRIGFILLAICLPLMLVSNIWLAYFEGLEQFKKLSVFRTISSLLTVVLPLLCVLAVPKFTALISGLFIARVVTMVVSWQWISKTINLTIKHDKQQGKSLLNFGGWLTVSSVVGPVMVYFDRFILSAMIGAKQVAFYTAPSELVIRMLTLPSAVSRTLFPMFSNALIQDKSKTYWLSVLSLGLGAFLISLPVFIFAEQILTLWMGTDFSGEPKWVLRILLVGFVFNAMAQVPFTDLQAKGYSKVTAIVHCIEVLPYVTILYWLTKNYGLVGVASAWTFRVTTDTLLLFLIQYRVVRITYE